MYKHRSRTTTIWATLALAASFGLWRILPESLRNQVLPTAHAATFTVNTADDHNDGVCNAADCTLREAINAANALVNSNTSPHNIKFVSSHYWTNLFWRGRSVYLWRHRQSGAW